MKLKINQGEQSMPGDIIDLGPGFGGVQYRVLRTKHTTRGFKELLLRQVEPTIGRKTFYLVPLRPW